MASVVDKKKEILKQYANAMREVAGCFDKVAEASTDEEATAALGVCVIKLYKMKEIENESQLALMM